jgi:hypothetical protein
MRFSLSTAAAEKNTLANLDRIIAAGLIKPVFYSLGSNGVLVR